MKRFWASALRYIRFTDKLMLLFCLLVSGVSVLCLYSIVHSGIGPKLGAYERNVIVQIGAIGMGMFCAVCLSLLDYHVLAKLWKIYVPLALFLVGLTFFYGVQVDETIDDKAWLTLPFGMTFQPAELMKICFILSLAYHLSKLKGGINRPINMILLCLHGALPVLLVHLQGDDGTALIFLFIFVSVVFLAGVSWKYLLPAAGCAAVAIPIVWQYVFSEDQRKRFLSVYFSAYADPVGSDYQQRLSRISIGSGQMTGKGLFQEEYWYVPKMHNDFIFSFVGQALGFVGALAVVGLLLAICIRSIHTAVTALDPLGTYICYGFFAMIFFQCALNIGMCLSVLPVIGVTLPLLSYGGSSVLITYLGMGLVLSVWTHRRKALFYD